MKKNYNNKIKTGKIIFKSYNSIIIIDNYLKKKCVISKKRKGIFR